jgi:hypothetical protein
MRTIALLGLTALLPLFAACNAVNARIEENQGLFDTYPPDQQAMIRAGRIGTGFDRTQVYMALGPASTQRGIGSDEEWFYTQDETRTFEVDKDVRQYAMERDEWERARRHNPDLPPPSLTMLVEQRRARILKSVHFVNGTVADYEEPLDKGLTDWVTTSPPPQ